MWMSLHGPDSQSLVRAHFFYRFLCVLRNDEEKKGEFVMRDSPRALACERHNTKSGRSET